MKMNVVQVKYRTIVSFSEEQNQISLKKINENYLGASV